MGPVYFWGSGMWIFPIIMLIVMLVVIFLFFGRGRVIPPWNYDERDSNKHISSDIALEILRQRYAKGEISKDEFEEMKKNLKS